MDDNRWTYWYWKRKDGVAIGPYRSADEARHRADKGSPLLRQDGVYDSGEEPTITEIAKS